MEKKRKHNQQNGYRNQKVNGEVLERILEEYLRMMDKEGDSYIPSNCHQLYKKAGVPKRTFYNNFSCLNSVVDESQKAFCEKVASLYHHLFYPMLNLEQKMGQATKIMAENRTLTEFARRRFDPALFFKAFLEFKPDILKLYPEVTDKDQQDYIYQEFILSYWELLPAWLRDGSEPEIDKEYYRILTARVSSIVGIIEIIVPSSRQTESL